MTAHNNRLTASKSDPFAEFYIPLVQKHLGKQTLRNLHLRLTGLEQPSCSASPKCRKDNFWVPVNDSPPCWW